MSEFPFPFKFLDLEFESGSSPSVMDTFLGSELARLCDEGGRRHAAAGFGQPGQVQSRFEYSVLSDNVDDGVSAAFPVSGIGAM